jgi:phosphatidylglycerophosphatase A
LHTTEDKPKSAYIPGLSRRVFRDPVLFLAFGLGFGLAKKAPGTFGTIPGIITAWLIGLISALALTPSSVLVSVLMLALIPFSVWICDSASRRLGVHDYGGIVLDEIVGVLVPFMFFDITPANLLLAFLWFRFFDVLKPWPISWIDRRVGGGLGIVFDDILAGIFALVAMLVMGIFFPQWIYT